MYCAVFQNVRFGPNTATLQLLAQNHEFLSNEFFFSKSLIREEKLAEISTGNTSEISIQGVIDSHFPKENHDILRFLNIKFGHPGLTWGQQKHAFRKRFDRGDAFCTSIYYHISKSRFCGLKRRFGGHEDILTQKMSSKIVLSSKFSLEPTEARC